MPYSHERNIAATWFGKAGLIFSLIATLYLLPLFLVPLDAIIIFVTTLTTYRIGYLLGYRILLPNSNGFKSALIGFGGGLIAYTWITTLVILGFIANWDHQPHTPFLSNIKSILEVLIFSTVFFGWIILFITVLCALFFYYRRKAILIKYAHEKKLFTSNQIKPWLYFTRGCILLFIIECFYNFYR